jgi:hypothetical protein
MKMNLSTLIKQLDDIESNAPSFRRSLSESVYRSPEMTKHWRKLDEGFFKGYNQYLKEVTLTPDQIQNIFKQAGQGGAAGADATKDPSKLEKIVDKVMPASQAANLEKSLPEPDAGPVQGFEQKAAAAVQNLPGADSATKQSLMQWVKNGLKKPETQQLILAALSAGLGGLISKVGPMLSMIPGGGPVVSAVTGALIAGAVAVASAKMQGKDWKSAFKGAIKPALMGGAAAVVGNLAASAVAGGIGAMTHKSDSEVAAQAQADADQASMDNQTNNLAGGANDQAAASDRSEIRVAGQPVVPGQPLTAQQMAVVDLSKNSGNTPAPEVQAAYDLAKQQGADTSSSDSSATPASDYPSAGKVRANLDQWRTDTGSPNAPKPITPDTPSDGSYQQAAPLGADGKPMQQVPMDEPVGQITPRPSIMMNPDGNGIQSIDGNPVPQQANTMPHGAGMDPNYLKQAAQGGGRFLIKPEDAQAALDWQAQNGGQFTPPKGDWSSGGRASYPGGLAQWYKDHPGIRENAINKQDTLREWLKREQLGVALTSVQLRPAVVEGIFDFFTGGKKDAPAGEKQEPTMGASADSLNKAWQDAGSPTDSEEIAKILQGAGIAPDAVAKIYTDLKIPAPGAAAPAGENPAEPAAPAATADQTQDAPSAATPTDAPTEPVAGQAAAAPAQPGAEPPPTQQAEKQSKIGVGQINKIVPTLRVRDLKSVQKNVDATLQKRSQVKQPTTEGFYSKFLGKEI